MSLINCPECGHEISTASVACVNCGRPVSANRPEIPRVVVEREPRTDQVPPWVIAPVVILGVLVLFGLIYFLSTSDDSNSNLSVNVNARRGETARDSDRTNDLSGPASSMPSSDVPTTAYPSSPQNVPGSAVDVPQTAKGTVLIDAKIASKEGRPQPVRNTRFYLLDKDVDTILADADLDPIEGQTLSGSLALAIADQSRYADFYSAAMRALKEHIKYTGSTDAMGKAQLGSVDPDSYYLFGVARTGEGFAMWNSSVAVIAGENAVNLTPQQLTPMPSASTEE